MNECFLTNGFMDTDYNYVISTNIANAIKYYIKNSTPPYPIISFKTFVYTYSNDNVDLIHKYIDGIEKGDFIYYIDEIFTYLYDEFNDNLQLAISYAKNNNKEYTDIADVSNFLTAYNKYNEFVKKILEDYKNNNNEENKTELSKLINDIDAEYKNFDKTFDNLSNFDVIQIIDDQKQKLKDKINNHTPVDFSTDVNNMSLTSQIDTLNSDIINNSFDNYITEIDVKANTIKLKDNTTVDKCKTTINKYIMLAKKKKEEGKLYISVKKSYQNSVDSNIEILTESKNKYIEVERIFNDSLEELNKRKISSETSIDSYNYDMRNLDPKITKLVSDMYNDNNEITKVSNQIKNYNTIYEFSQIYKKILSDENVKKSLDAYINNYLQTDYDKLNNIYNIIREIAPDNNADIKYNFDYIKYIEYMETIRDILNYKRIILEDNERETITKDVDVFYDILTKMNEDNFRIYRQQILWNNIAKNVKKDISILLGLYKDTIAETENLYVNLENIMSTIEKDKGDLNTKLKEIKEIYTKNSNTLQQYNEDYKEYTIQIEYNKRQLNVCEKEYNEYKQICSTIKNRENDIDKTVNELKEEFDKIINDEPVSNTTESEKQIYTYDINYKDEDIPNTYNSENDKKNNYVYNNSNTYNNTNTYDNYNAYNETNTYNAPTKTNNNNKILLISGSSMLVISIILIIVFITLLAAKKIKTANSCIGLSIGCIMFISSIVLSILSFKK